MSEETIKNPCSTEPCPCEGFYEPQVRSEHLEPQAPAKELPDIVVYTHEKGLLIICSNRSLGQVRALINARWELVKRARCSNGCLIDQKDLFHYHFRLRPKAHFTVKVQPPSDQGGKGIG